MAVLYTGTAERRCGCGTADFALSEDLVEFLKNDIEY